MSTLPMSSGPTWEARTDTAARRAGGESALWRVTRALAPPMLVFAVARLVLMLAGSSVAVDPMQPAPWLRWDANNYLHIAKHGYSLVQNPVDGSWHGTAGWFPLFPAVVRALVELTGQHADVVMLLVASVFHLLTLMLLWNRWILPADDSHRWLMLLSAGFFPGVIYQYAAFPISMTTFFVLLHLHLILRGRWIISGAAGALASAAHPIGCPLAVVSILFAALPGRISALTTRDRFGALLAAFICLLGGATVLLVHQLTTGHWDAYFLVQRSIVERSMQNPLDTFAFHLRALPGSFRFQAPSHQFLLVGALVLSVLGAMARNRKNLARPDWLIALFMAVCWVFPMAYQVTSEHRQNAVLLPSVVLTRFLPLRTRALLLGLFLLVAFEIARRYLLGYLM